MAVGKLQTKSEMVWIKKIIYLSLDFITISIQM